ncbi:hypothetical protein SORBI_3005G079025 [Sorghum bicolor]|uniref:Uncharacterized protein n=1 Tax=Sorghum bicolor TaxID=4558 RepID=A0A1Z5RH85_SORBI|nr:hypothetical protein SORBI_3005G079025 [Sorghum bicolor]
MGGKRPRWVETEVKTELRQWQRGREMKTCARATRVRDTWAAWCTWAGPDHLLLLPFSFFLPFFFSIYILLSAAVLKFSLVGKASPRLMPYSLKRKVVVTRHASPYRLENIASHTQLLKLSLQGIQFLLTNRRIEFSKRGLVFSTFSCSL